jgi:alpha-N-arabinofuranosidase
LVNLHPGKPVPVTLSILGSTQSHVSGEVLTADAMDSHNTVGNPAAVHPTALSGASLEGGKLAVTLPAKSVVVLRLD